MVNYYELLEVSKDARMEEIEQAIKKTRRLWNNRANSPDASIRAEAERHVREVAEAEKILLDRAKREEYNQELAQNHTVNPQTNGNNENVNTSDWEDDFFAAYNRDMNDVAAQIAYRIINVNDKNGRAWFLYGEALRRGGNISDGLQALKHASMLMPDSDDVYRQLGFAYLDMDQLSNAYSAFKTASKINPSNCEYLSLAANCLRLGGQIKDALTEARQAYNNDPNDNGARYALMFALYEDALASASYNRSSGKHLITNKVQLDYINNLLKTMSIAIPENENKDECVKAMDEIVQLVVDAESSKGGGLLKPGKIGYEYNYSISNQDTRNSGIH